MRLTKILATLAVSLFAVLAVASSAAAAGTTPVAAIDRITGIGYAESSYVAKVTGLKGKQFSSVASAVTFRKNDWSNDVYKLSCTSTVGDPVNYRVVHFVYTTINSSLSGSKYLFNGYGEVTTEDAVPVGVGDPCPSNLGTGVVTYLSATPAFYESGWSVSAIVPGSPPIVQAILSFPNV